MTIVERIGQSGVRLIDTFAGLSTLLVESLKTIFTEPGKGTHLITQILKKQLLFTGFDALKVISATALLIGVVTIIEVITMLPQVGGESYMGMILVLVVIRELGPLLTAFIIIGRSGTAVSTEIGNMMVNHEIQAMETMGINPLRYLVLPRIAGVTIAILCLALYFNIVTIFGGYIVAQLAVDYPFSAYWADVTNAMGLLDVLGSLLKCLSFGLIISTVCCYYGFSVKVASTEVPQVTTRAVVVCIYLCFLVNCIITALLYF